MIPISTHIQAILIIKDETVDFLNNVEGDANCDDALTIADTASVLQYLGNKDKYGLSAQALFNADVNGGGLTTSDTVAIQTAVANK